MYTQPPEPSVIRQFISQTIGPSRSLITGDISPEQYIEYCTRFYVTGVVL